tara:strand:+ start:15534 stop:16961 length:1428 start_codon:yes stop_codon:yes gene_type:complete
MKDNTVSFGFLGIDYQKRLIAQMLNDSKYTNTIIDILEPQYFTDTYLKMIIAEIKNAHDESEVVPDFGSLEIRLLNNVKDDTTRTFIKYQINELSEITLNDSEYIKDSAMNFCKQQELKKSIRDMQTIIDKGEADSYDECEEILRKALEVGNNKDEGIHIFDNLTEVLAEDFRKPISTGILGLDAKMDGGLSKGELGVVLAPFGVGKTTMITKIANSAYDLGHNVLQIFFEDIPKVIQRKHFSCWTGIPLNDLGEANNRDTIMNMVEDKTKGKGYLKLRKFPSDGTTISHIKKYVRHLASSGQSPDIILIDYIDCLSPGKKFDNEYTGEGVVMRQFESLLTEFDMVGWTAVQGNRSSINADIVDSTMIGGSIKKGQIGHFIVSIAKTLEQKETGRANMSILKSRFGVDGITFNDIRFDNAKIQIEIEPNNTRSTYDMKDKNRHQVAQQVNNEMEMLMSKFNTPIEAAPEVDENNE